MKTLQTSRSPGTAIIPKHPGQSAWSTLHRTLRPVGRLTRPPRQPPDLGGTNPTPRCRRGHASPPQTGQRRRRSICNSSCAAPHAEHVLPEGSRRPISKSCTPSRRHFHSRRERRAARRRISNRPRQAPVLHPARHAHRRDTHQPRPLGYRSRCLVGRIEPKVRHPQMLAAKLGVTSLAAVALDGPAVQLQRAGNLAVDTLQLRQCTPQRLGIFKHAYRFTIVLGRQTPLPDVNANHGAGLFSLRFRHLAHHRHMPPNTVMLHRAFTHPGRQTGMPHACECPRSSASGSCGPPSEPFLARCPPGRSYPACVT